jgi:hypothetical protein
MTHRDYNRASPLRGPMPPHRSGRLTAVRPMRLAAIVMQVATIAVRVAFVRVQVAAVAPEIGVVMPQLTPFLGHAGLVAFAMFLAQLAPILVALAHVAMNLAPVVADFPMVLAQILAVRPDVRTGRRCRIIGVHDRDRGQRQYGTDCGELEFQHDAFLRWFVQVDNNARYGYVQV